MLHLSLSSLPSSKTAFAEQNLPTYISNKNPYPAAVGAPRSTSHHRDDGLALQILLSHLERVDRKC